MLTLHCYAIVPETDERNKLTSNLRHRDLPFIEQGITVSLDANFLTYRSVEKTIGLFEEVESLERGFTVIGNTKEVPNDTG